VRGSGRIEPAVHDEPVAVADLHDDPIALLQEGPARADEVRQVEAPGDECPGDLARARGPHLEHLDAAGIASRPIPEAQPPTPLRAKESPARLAPAGSAGG